MPALRSVPKFSQYIRKIADRHEFPLDVPYAHLRLEMGSFQPLIIEKVGKHFVNVGHLTSGDSMPDPIVTFWINPQNGNWYPAISRMLADGGYPEQLITFADDTPKTFFALSQHDVAGFCEGMWLSALKGQKRLENSEPSWRMDPDKSYILRPDAAPEVIVPRSGTFTLNEMRDVVQDRIAFMYLEANYRLIVGDEMLLPNEPDWNDLASRLAGGAPVAGPVLFTNETFLRSGDE
jgi:hypothetical protein